MSDYENNNIKRNKKSDKAKKNFDMNGNFSSKHIRIKEALMEKPSNHQNNTKKV